MNKIKRLTVLYFFLSCLSSYGQTDVVGCSSGIVDTNAEDGILVDSQCGELNTTIGTINGSIEIKGSGNLTINANITTEVAGNIIIESGATLTINGDIADIDGSITNDGMLLITGSITAEGKLEVKGTGTVTLDGGSFTSTNDGVVIESGATINMKNGSTIDASTGVENEGSINADGSGNTIIGGVTGGGFVDPSLGDCSSSCTDDPSLPVELIFFDGKQEGNSCSLSWATASEINNDFFEVHKSYDGHHFKSIGRVDGSGSSNLRINYSFSDSLFTRNSYYQLKQVDFDGQFELSKVILVRNIHNPNHLTFTPNPVRNGADFNLLVDNCQNVKVRIYNFGGHMMFEASGDNVEIRTQFFLETLDAGVYLLEVTTEFGVLTEKLVKSEN